MQDRWKVFYARHREEERIRKKEFYDNNKAKVKSYCMVSEKRTWDKVFNIIPNRCYYESDACDGPLQWDHKYGDGKGDHGRIYPNKVFKNPDNWMRLCTRHNSIKYNLPKDIFESMILDTAEQIERTRAYEQGYPYSLASDEPFPTVKTAYRANAV